MAYGMPPGFEQLLRKKYAILQQQADSGTTTANANAEAARAAAGLDKVRTQLMPEESAAEIARTRAQAGLFGAQSNLVGKEVSWYDRLRKDDLRNSAAQRGLWGANAMESRARGGLYGAQTDSERQNQEDIGGRFRDWLRGQGLIGSGFGRGLPD